MKNPDQRPGREMADMAIRLAKKPRRQSRALKWDAAFTAGR